MSHCRSQVAAEHSTDARVGVLKTGRSSGLRWSQHDALLLTDPGLLEMGKAEHRRFHNG